MKQSRVDTSAQEDIANLVHRMRYDWNSRAIDDARFFVAFGQRGQKDEDFDATAAEVVARIRRDLPWLAQQTVRSRRILEIGCGVGRLMRHLAADCGEIHGVDISDEMIRLGEQWLTGVPHAHLHLVMENDLRAFADASFDVVYSYAVMQHLPDRVLFWRYLKEAFRVLKTGGILVAQFNGMAHDHSLPDTWAGIWIPAEEVAVACRAAGARVRSLEGENTQYIWVTAQKTGKAPAPLINGLLCIDGIIGANTLQGTIFAGGSHGFLSLYLRGLPDDLCDVNELTVQIGPSTAPTFFVSCSDGAGQRQINAFVPTDVPLGTAPVQLMWRNSVVSSPYFVRVIESPPAAPRILVVTDGHEVGRHNAIYCGWAKIWVTDLLAIDLFRATIGGIPIRELDFFCEDIRARRYQINIRVPDELSEGVTDLVVYVADVALPAVSLTIYRSL